MKIGVSSYSFAKHIEKTGCDYIEICRIAKEIGFDGIEFIDLKPKAGATVIETAREIRKYCDEISLEIIAYTVGANLIGENAEREVEALKRHIDVAHELGAPLLRHDICRALPKEHLYTYKDAIAEMVPRIREVTEYAGKFGIRTSSENHGHVFQAPERVEELILAVGSDNYGWLCDMGNFLCVDADPVKSVTIASRYVFHVHAKDFLYKSGEAERPAGFFGTLGGNHLRGTVIGHGVVPVRTCISILKNAGYDGYVSIEFEGPEEPLGAIKCGYENLKRLI